MFPATKPASILQTAHAKSSIEARNIVYMHFFSFSGLAFYNNKSLRSLGVKRKQDLTNLLHFQDLVR